MERDPLRVAPRPRAFVGVRGPEAIPYVNRMVSNDVAALEVGEACEALLLTPKARIVATLTAFRRADDDLLLLTEPALGERLLRELGRMRFAARCEILAEDHRSTLVLGVELAGAVPNRDYGLPACEVLDADVEGEPVAPEELERLRIRARTPVVGRELDDRVLPAEAGLDERAVSFTKGCYPGQEPVARLHYRGHPNRGLRVLAIDPGETPEADAPLVLEEREVGRVTSAVPADGGLVALGYVRREVPEDAVLALPDGRSARIVA